MAELLGWGAGGIQAYKHDQAVEAQTELNRIAMGVEQAKLERAEADAQLEAEANAAMAEIFRGKKAGPDGGDGEVSTADALAQTGEQLIAMGASERGISLLETAAKLKKEQRLTMSAESSHITNLMDRQLKQADLIAQELTDADTPEKVAVGIANLRATGAYDEDELAVLERMASDPATRAEFLNRSMSAAERAKIELQRIRDEEADRDRDDRIAIQRANSARADRAQAETARHNRVQEKAGGASSAALPNGPQTEIIRSVIQNVILKGNAIPADQEDEFKATLNAATLQIFSDAQAIIAEDKSATMDQAVARAVARSYAAGDWNYVDGMFSDDLAFNPKGKTPEEPLTGPLPKSKKALVVGRYYTLGSGEVAKWNGSAFEAEE